MSQPPSSDARRKWNLIIDVAKSTHATNAVLVAKDEYVGNEHKGYSAPVSEDSAELFKVERKVRGASPVVDTAYLLKTCNHCDNAPCKKVGGDAVTKRDDGIMMIDPVKSKGRKDIAKACPFGAIVWNEELQIPQNWTFDAHLLDAGWPVPRCVEVTPLNAIEAVKITDAEMQKRVESEGLEVLRPELRTKPRVYYKNLYRFRQCFIGATLIGMDGDVENCVEGASIDLMKEGVLLQSVTSDAYGELKFDRLEPSSGTYELIARHEDYGEARADCELGAESLYLGALLLT
ncbi:MAG: 4Fe-4S dicluster domain-containing protein [Pseudomonadota bacterium]